MQRILLTAATLAVLVYALVLGVKWLSPRIENDLAGRITTELAQSGQLWAQATVKGREVTLSGEAPSAEAQAEARTAVAKVFGIARMDDLTTLPGQVVSNGLIISATDAATAKALSKAERKALAAAEKAYTLTITKAGEALAISGTVPDEDAKALLLQLAKLHFPDAQQDTSGLMVQAEGAPAGWRSAAGTVLFNLTNLEQADVMLEGRTITVSGTVLSADFAEAAEAKIRAAVPSLYQVAFAVQTTAPVEQPVVTPEMAEQAISATVAKVAEVKEEVKAVATEAKAETVKTVDAMADKLADKVKETAAVIAAVEPAAGPATCETLAAVEKEKLMFDFGKAGVRKADAPVVARVASAVKACSTATVEVKGFTDETGSATYNQWLSEQRAEAAVRALVRQGAQRSALTPKGYGENFPAATNATRKGRAENRRVEFDAR